jgi:SAM-dependent methyltransferase
MMLLVSLVLAIILVMFLVTALTGAPYVPTHRKQAALAFRALRPVTSADMVLDIGSGDGVVLQEAIHAGAGMGVGYEINPLLVAVSHFRLRAYRSNIKLYAANFWRTPFPDEVTIVYTFGETRDIAKMYGRVQEEASRLGRSIDFISYAFTVPHQTPVANVGGQYLYTVAPLQ